MRASVFISLLATSLILAAGTSPAGELSVDVRFSTKEASMIRDYFEHFTVAKKPGKKSRRQLPPGIAKNLGRGKPLPPGIAKQLLPGDLIVQLPPVTDGFERVVVDGKVLLVEIATQVVHDILVDVILN